MVIFFQGCNLTCRYCHNPETQKMCNNCGNCISACKAGALSLDGGKVIWNKKLCVNCGTCIKVCKNFSNPKYINYSLDEIYDIVMKNEDFIDGITVSGGECTLHYEFIKELFKKVKESSKLSTFADTNGTINKKDLIELTKYTDGFMYDLKAFDENIHINLTGKSNKEIIENIKYSSGAGNLYEIRTVVVEGYTDKKEEIIKIASFIKELNDYTRYKMIRFRPNGVKTELSEKGEFNEEKFFELFNEAKKILKDRIVM